MQHETHSKNPPKKWNRSVRALGCRDLNGTYHNRCHVEQSFLKSGSE